MCALRHQELQKTGVKLNRQVQARQKLQFFPVKVFSVDSAI